MQSVDLSAFSHGSLTETEIDKLWASIESIEAQNEETDATLAEINRREALQKGYREEMERLKLEALGKTKARQDFLSKKSAGKSSS